MNNTPWKIELVDAAARDLRKLDPETTTRLLRFMQERLTTPDDYRRPAGAVKSEVKFWKHRFGNYGIVCRHEDADQCIVVLACECHKDAYLGD